MKPAFFMQFARNEIVFMQFCYVSMLFLPEWVVDKCLSTASSLHFSYCRCLACYYQLAADHEVEVLQQKLEDLKQ